MNRIEIIKQELEKEVYTALVEKQDYPAIASALNYNPLIDNPGQQKNIPKPINILEMWQQITPQEGLEIYKVPGLKSDIESAANLNKRDNLQALIDIASQLVSEASKGKIQALLLQTIPDPNYKSKIEQPSIAEQLELGTVSDIEIQSALHLE